MQGVLMATCHDDVVFNALMGKSGVVDVKVDARGQIEVPAPYINMQRFRGELVFKAHRLLA